MEYEGDPNFLDTGLNKLLESMVEVAERILPFDDVQETDVVVNEAASSTPSSSVRQDAADVSAKAFTTSMIASHYGAKTATELALCAMAFLELKNQTVPNDRSAILSEMKNVHSTYNATMAKNNSTNLKRLAKNRTINDRGSGKYSLSKDERQKFENLIAQFD